MREQKLTNLINKFKNGQDVIVLVIESSCDETACALVKNGRQVLSNVIVSQIDIHKLYGGVVPEIASRNHVEAIDKVVDLALKNANKTLDDVDMIAVTYGAGLVGALLVGVSFAKGLSQATGIPLLGVNHIEAHVCANYLNHPDLEPPYMCLLVSGGHTAIIRVDGYTDYTVLASTVDDAIGEAFDKVARVLGYTYPGGPNVDKNAKLGSPTYKLPSVIVSNGNFSYSGLKTAVINTVHNIEQKGEEVNKADMCCSFSHSAIDGLIARVETLIKEHGLTRFAVAGGVGANSYLRQCAQQMGDKYGYQVYLPELVFCTDNAAMVASQGYFWLKEGKPLSDLSLNACPTLKLRGKKPQ
ncbi:MAG: tRNA (adenosine(37)-N6)-threonylcarbamoyltransferase complex transferase subunit TsaD [Clostridia bacterium]|nr:tRNA (adenosine(37)-N6)-threonylcarbamoyltransferase complex transferase subunit TsaD [Clostridia bacterium]